MRTLGGACLLWLALWGASAGQVPPSAPAVNPAALPRIVVGFPNQPAAAPGPAGATGRRYTGGGYRISQSAQQLARRVASEYSLREVASWPIKALSMHCVVFEITNGRPPAEVLAALSHDSRVVLAQPLHEFHTLSGPPAGYNDPLYDLQTNLPELGIPLAHQRAQGAGIRIALIDTAVDVRHPDLRGRIMLTRSFVGRQGAGDSLRHGTAMAGIIAADANNRIGIVGIAPLAELEVFEACWQLQADSDPAACNTFTLAQALAAALESGVPLVNLSVAGPADPLLTALVEAGLRRGVIFVGATGSSTGGFPTAVPGVIAAAGSEGPVPPDTFAAPSRHVLTLRPGAQYDFESGTSVAAAELTGVIALLMSASPTRLTAAAIRRLLQPGGVAAAAAPAAPVRPASINAAAALARLDLGAYRECVAQQADPQRRPPASGCTVLAGYALDGL